MGIALSDLSVGEVQSKEGISRSRRHRPDDPIGMHPGWIVKGSDTLTSSIQAISTKHVPKDSDVQVNASIKKEKPIWFPTEPPNQQSYSNFQYLFRILRFGGIDPIMLFAVLSAVSFGATMPAFSIVFGNMMQAYAAPVSQVEDEVRKYVFWFLVLAGFAFVTGGLQIGLFILFASRQGRRLREAYYASILTQEIPYFDRDDVNAGSVITQLSSDIETIENAVGTRMGTFCMNISMFVVGIAVAFYYGPSMTGVMLALSPLLVLGTVLIMKVMTNYARGGAKGYEGANLIASESFSGIRTVKAFVQEDKIVRWYTEHLNKAKEAGLARSLFTGFAAAIFNVGIFIFYAVSLWYGGKQIVDGTMSFGDIFKVLFSGIMGIFGLGQAGNALSDFIRGASASVGIFDVIDRKPLIHDRKHCIDFPVATYRELGGAAIEFDDVDFAYPSRLDTLVVKGLHLRIAAGTTIALVGESGAGKSTTLALLERFYDPEWGVVRVGGYDIRDLTLHSLRGAIGIVSQEPSLFNMSVRDNIAYGNPNVSFELIKQAAVDSFADEFINALSEGYDTMVSNETLSGGQKQRIAIARAFLQNPAVLLLDEATSALDATSEMYVMAAINRLKQNRTVLIIAHRLSTVKTADYIAVFKNGNVVEMGTHEHLRTIPNGAYVSLMSNQLENTVTPGPAENVAYVDYKTLFDATVGSPLLRNQQTMLNLMENLAIDDDGVSFHRARSGGSSSRSVDEDYSSDSLTFDESKRIEKSKSDVEKLEQIEKHLQNESITTFTTLQVLQRLFRYARDRRWACVPGFIGGLLNGGMWSAFGAVFGEFSAIFTEPPAQLALDLWKVPVMLSAIAAISGFGAFLSAFFFGKFGEEINYHLRNDMIYSILRLDTEYFDKHHSGTLSSAMSELPTMIYNGFGEKLGTFIYGISGMIVGVVIAFIYSWRTACIMIGVLPLLSAAAAMQSFVDTGMQQGDKERGPFAKASSIVSESIINIRTVSSFNRQNLESQRFKLALDPNTVAQRKRALVGGIAFGLSQASMFLIDGFIFWFGGYEIGQLGNDIQSVTAAFIAVLMGCFALGTGMQVVADIGKAFRASRVAFNIIDTKPTIDPTVGIEPSSEQLQGDIQLKHIKFSYPTRPNDKIFHDFNLTIKQNESCALVGLSGSGKSTVLCLLQRLYEPLRGSITINNIPISSMSIHGIRRRVAVVSQQPVLFTRSIAENIAFCEHYDGCIDMERVETAAKASHIHNFIVSLPDGYHSFINNTSISGGQKQRLCIARAFYMNPDIMLLDEATSALDAESEKIVQSAISDLVNGETKLMKRKPTTIVVAHRLNTIRNCDKIHVLKGGELLESGTHDALLRNPNGPYAQLVQDQIGG